MPHHQTLKSILERPVPNQVIAVQRKAGYRSYPLLKNTKRNTEPLVDISEYGIAGQSYYSRHNHATGEPIPAVNSTIYIRRSLAERLADINLLIQQSTEVTELLGGQIELYIQEGLRSEGVQRELYEVTFPRLIKEQQPKLSNAEVLARRDQLIAKPTQTGGSPAPHATGAAVDVTIRYANPDLDYAQRSLLPMGHKGTLTTVAASPDYYEKLDTLNKAEGTIRRNRRAFYWIMRGALSPSSDSGLHCNPTEWWHWSHGDQLWAALEQAPYAFYDAADVPRP